ncbi:MAG TPA: hypothetical protein VJ184_12400 [Chryseolinea sp.]|nr:hypothetical protein [Chryseolinea sp.]
MKKTLILFGSLDVIGLVNNYTYIENYLERLYFDFITIGILTLYASFLFSAYFLIKQRRIGIWIYYAQFPLRLLFMILSFGFLLRLPRMFDDWMIVYDVFMWIILGLEILRLLISIRLDMKYTRTTSSIVQGHS